MLTKFKSTQKEEAVDYYNENGYVIIEKLLPKKEINNFLSHYNSFKNKKYYIFRSQDTNRPELLKVNEYNFIEHSLLDPKDLPFTDGFAEACEKCITDSHVSEMLSAISGKQKHTIWQSMFFDRSTGTVEHQDHYYLDTKEDGKLVAAWFAMEDIHEEAGCFFVCPKSHKSKILSRDLKHEEFVYATKEMISEGGYEKKLCNLKEGDVLFWHPLLIHGAFKNDNPKHSRKSFTAHYIPEGNTRHDDRQIETISSKFNPDILVWKNTEFKKKIEHIKRLGRYTLNKLTKSKVKMEMKGEKY